MNNLHRELAPISSAAWADMADEARRTFTARVAARRVVDMPDPAGAEFSALGTGHVSDLAADTPGIQALQRRVVRVVELRAVTETTDHGYPVHEHITRMLGDGKIIWAPALDDALLLSARGGDYELHLGLDAAIGYSSHTAETVDLYLRETLTFRVNTSEASVVITR